MSLKVQFSSRGEWLAELRQAREYMTLDAKLPVRVAIEWRDTKLAPVVLVSVVAGFVANEQLHELRVYCGESFGESPGGDEAEKKARAILDEIGKVCADLKLEVRSGKYAAAAAGV